MPGWIRSTAFLVFALTFMVEAGCGKSVRKVALHGTIRNNDKPLTTGPRGFVQIIFYPVEEGDQPGITYPAVVDSQHGTFKVDGIPVGKYKVAVQQMDPAPVNDKLKGAFSAQQTKITRDVTDDGEMNIDIAKP